MILYTVTGGKYFPAAESFNDNSRRSVYVNLTNRCNNDCPFCLRNKKIMSPEKSLWLDKEPHFGEIKAELDALNWDLVKEIVFCGFGEPTIRLTELTMSLTYIKATHPQISTRLNTNGLGNLEHGRNIVLDFENLLDVVSISLNASTPERYLKITRSKFGLQAFNAMLTFAELMEIYVPQVIMTVVDKVTPPDEIDACRKICQQRGLTLRVRPYESK